MYVYMHMYIYTVLYIGHIQFLYIKLFVICSLIVCGSDFKVCFSQSNNISIT